MNKINLTYLLIILLLLTGQSFAQENQKERLSSFKRLFADRNMLEETFNDVEKMEENYYESVLGIDADTAEIVRSLQNPFIPQLPKPVPIIEPPPRDTNPRGPGPTRMHSDQPVEHAPAPQPEEPLPQFYISGLVWNSDLPQAIVNGQIVTTGDTISGCIIIDIRQEGLEMTSHGKNFIVEPKGAEYEE